VCVSSKNGDQQIETEKKYIEYISSSDEIEITQYIQGGAEKNFSTV